MICGITGAGFLITFLNRFAVRHFAENPKPFLHAFFRTPGRFEPCPYIYILTIVSQRFFKKTGKRI